MPISKPEQYLRDKALELLLKGASEEDKATIGDFLAHLDRQLIDVGAGTQYLDAISRRVKSRAGRPLLPASWSSCRPRHSISFSVLRFC